jgi:single-stranded-DNA-specific exonuclease
LVITKNEEGYKGSGRSIEEFNIVEALEECSELLDKYGGHPAACGFSLKEENLEKFKEKIAKIAERKLKGVNLTPKIKIEAEIGLDEISEELIAEVEKFAPFGQNNERPKFLSRGVKIVDIITMGIDGKHIKLRVKSEESRIISAIGFSQAEQWRDLRIGDKIDIVYYIEMNEFNGRSEAQLKIVDIKMCDK